MTSMRIVLLVLACLVLPACDRASEDGGSGTKTAADEPAMEETETTTVAEEDVEEGDVASEEVELAEVGDSGISGTAELSADDDGRLAIAIELDEGFDPVHGIEARRGSCDDVIDPGAVDSVVGEVASYTLPDVEDGAMETDKPLPEDVVSEGSYALVVYDGEDLDGDVAACAQVEVE